MSMDLLKILYCAINGTMRCGKVKDFTHTLAYGFMEKIPWQYGKKHGKAKDFTHTSSHTTRAGTFPQAPQALLRRLYSSLYIYIKKLDLIKK